MSLSNTFVHGWAPETTAETSTITLNSSNYWKFGALTEAFDFGMEKHEWRPNYYLNGRDPNSLTLARKFPDNTLAFQPTNGIWWYYFLGDSSTTTGVHTVSGIDTGTLPTFTYRWEDTGGTSDEYSSIVGNAVESLVMTCNFGNQAALPMVMAISMAGIKQQTPTVNAAHNGNAYPTDDGTMPSVTGVEVSDLYRYDSNMAFTWDSGDSADNYTNQLEQIQYTGVNILQKQDLINQAEREFIYSGNRAHSLVLRLKRGTNSAIFNDFYSDNLFDAVFKIYNSATNYTEVTFNDVGINALKQPYSPTNESPFWQVECMVKSVTPVIKDGVANSYYGD